MKIQVLSDTHGNKYNISKEADVIVHAGDFGNNPNKALDFYNLCKSMGKDCIFVLGNHDYYYTDIKETLKFFRERPEIPCLSFDKTVEINGYTFVGGTLFTNFRENTFDFSDKSASEIFQKEAQDNISDFLITYFDSKIVTPQDYISLFNQTYNNILKYKNKDKVIVVTHFPPHLACLDPYWGNHPLAKNLNPYFINDIDIEGFDLWIAGHTHSSVDTTVNGCRLLVNPLGYPNEHMKNGFKEEFIIEV